MFKKFLPRALGLCALGAALTLGAQAVPSNECAVLSLDRPVYNPGDTAVLSIEAAPGLIPFLFVSPDPDPVTTSPFGGRRLGAIPASGTMVLKRTLVTCEQPEKYMQVTLFDPETRRPVCVSNAVFLAIDRAGFCGGGEPQCGPCDGKVSELTLRYNGGAPAGIEVFQKKVDDAIFSGTVPAGGLFSLVGQDKKGTLATEIQIFVDGALAEKIHTSCSRPIGVGLIQGDFEVIAGASRNGGPLCPLDQEPPGEEPSDDLCEGKNKPRCLTLVYTGADCSATQSGQDDGKVHCEDSGALPAQVVIEARDKKGDKLYFLDAVDLGQAFVIDAGNAGDDTLKSATFVDIFDANGNLLQSIEFHTSCSQPLSLGDRFGALELVGFNAACN